jgi:uncharacterized membrane protein YccC
MFADVTYRQWEREARAMVDTLVATLETAREMTGRGPCAMRSTGDQLRAASQHALRWLPDHRSPRADLDDLLEKTAHSYASLGQLLEREASSPTAPRWSAIDREMTGLYRALTETMAVMNRESAH